MNNDFAWTSYKDCDSIESNLINELKESDYDHPEWYPNSVGILDQTILLAHTYVARSALEHLPRTKDGLVNNRVMIEKDNLNSDILRKRRWVRNRGSACPHEIPSSATIRSAFRSSHTYLKESGVCLEDDVDARLIDGDNEAVFCHIRIGVCHILSSIFYGGIGNVV